MNSYNVEQHILVFIQMDSGRGGHSCDLPRITRSTIPEQENAKIKRHDESAVLSWNGTPDPIGNSRNNERLSVARAVETSPVWWLAANYGPLSKAFSGPVVVDDLTRAFSEINLFRLELSPKNSSVITMDSEAWPPEKLISCLSHQPVHILEGMIKISEPAKRTCTSIQRQDNSSIGMLDCLPFEILQWVLDLLDYQSLFRVLRSSVLAKRAVESLRSYRDLMDHAPQTLKALGLTRLIHVHSASTLHNTLKSVECISCGSYASDMRTMLLWVSARNYALWAITVNQAKKCFDLPLKQLMRIPVLYSISDAYSVRRALRRRVQRLVSVKDAKRLAIAYHGSLETSDAPIVPPIITMNEKALREFFLFERLRTAPLQPLNLDLSKVPTEQNTPTDDHHGMASIPFPSLKDNVLENGLWCSGCASAFLRYRLGKLPSDVISELVPEVVNLFSVLRGRKDRVLSKTDFLRHVKHCYGAQRLVAESAFHTINGKLHSWMRVDDMLMFLYCDKWKKKVTSCCVHHSPKPTSIIPSRCPYTNLYSKPNCFVF